MADEPISPPAGIRISWTLYQKALVTGLGTYASLFAVGGIGAYVFPEHRRLTLGLMAAGLLVFGMAWVKLRCPRCGELLSMRPFGSARWPRWNAAFWYPHCRWCGFDLRTSEGPAAGPDRQAPAARPADSPR